MEEEIKPVYIVILNYMGWQDTIECMEAVAKNLYPRTKIIVVDNASPNDSVERLTVAAAGIEPLVAYPGIHKGYKLYDNESRHELLKDQYFISIIKAPNNGGFASGNNIAIELLHNEDAYVFLVNPDMVIEPQTVSVLVEHYNRTGNHKQVATCRIHSYHNSSEMLYCGLVKLNPKTATISELSEPVPDADYVCGGALFTHASAYKDVGLMTEEYFLYWEDADWCYHAKKKGYQLVSVQGAKAYDKGGTSIGRGYLAEYYYTRNGLMFFKKIDKPTWTIILSGLFLRLPKKILLGQINRAKAVLNGTFDFIAQKY